MLRANQGRLALLSEVRPMNVNLIGVGAGYSYVVSGPTHQCYEDITLMRGVAQLSGHVARRSHNGGIAFGRVVDELGPKIFAP